MDERSMFEQRDIVVAQLVSAGMPYNGAQRLADKVLLAAIEDDLAEYA